jgi:glutamate-ammonia-ligase adenylyltransferase
LGAARRHPLCEAARKGIIALRRSRSAHSGIIALGMGNLGARELNYSSDIDLIALYDPMLVQVSARHGIQSFMVRQMRDLVRMMRGVSSTRSEQRGPAISKSPSLRLSD